MIVLYSASQLIACYSGVYMWGWELTLCQLSKLKPWKGCPEFQRLQLNNYQDTKAFLAPSESLNWWNEWDDVAGRLGNNWNNKV